MKDSLPVSSNITVQLSVFTLNMNPGVFLIHPIVFIHMPAFGPEYYSFHSGCLKNKSVYKDIQRPELK